ncbi:sulfatase [Opitutia bacterium ISCC 52]|nr:sulfatase [Opitutae bacterium ISCC 52]
MTFFRVTLFFFISCIGCLSIAQDSRPNVLLISIDDLNDWAGKFNGNPQMLTPHLDRFAEKGAVVFQNTHCAGPVCGPSRSAMMSGFMPDRTGAYGNSHNMLKSALVQEYATLPEYFSKNGYTTINKGKIFHAHASEHGLDRGQWAWDTWLPREGGAPVDKTKYYSRREGVYGGKKMKDSPYADPRGSEFGWGPTIGGKEEMSDYQTAQWAADLLQEPSEKPFFLAVGISKPHLPWYVPQKYFDRYPLDQVIAPVVDENDFDDVLNAKGEPAYEASLDYLWTSQSDELYKRAARAYMASSSFADDCVGVVLDGLAKSPHRDNTIVVIWGDHGWHLGEKLRYRKGSLWAESTRAPLMIRLPGMDKAQDCEHAVNLLDLHPTVIDLCGLPARPDIDGRSIVPLLENPTQDWPYPTVTTQGYGNHSVVYEDWHYIQRRDGVNELYHLKSDPYEHKNLIRSDNPVAAQVLAQLKSFVPTDLAPELPKNEPGLSKEGFDMTLKKTRNLAKLK